MAEKYYAERDVMALDRAGGYYIRHVGAMTAEKLHDKSEIAAELAWRDCVIDELLNRLGSHEEFLDQLSQKLNVSEN